jgi:hypothetical protein
VRTRREFAPDKTQGESRFLGEGDAIRRVRVCVRPGVAAIFAAIVSLSIAAPALASNPLSVISETFSDWKDRLFGKPHPTVDAPADGFIALQPDHATRIRIDASTPEREFPKGKSRYRVIDLPAGIEHAAVRIQITAMPREHAFGHEVFKPYFYTLNDDDTVRDTIEVKPLHLDIRPFRRTRLLGCTTLDKVSKLALATVPDVVGKSYESEVRDAIKAPTQGGFYYATDAVKVKLPWAATGELVLEITEESAAGKGC